MKEECENCRFWRRSTTDDRYTYEGTCRRYAPQAGRSLDMLIGEAIAHLARHVIGDPDPDDKGHIWGFEAEGTEAWTHPQWPEAAVDDWCGEWELRKEPINEKS